MEKISVKNNNLVIEIPLKVKRFCPYEGKNIGDMDNICGLIDKKECGFAYFVDRYYKGKSDDVSIIFYQYYNGKNDFKKLCKKLGIKVVEYL